MGRAPGAADRQPGPAAAAVAHEPVRPGSESLKLSQFLYPDLLASEADAEPRLEPLCVDPFVGLNPAGAREDPTVAVGRLDDVAVTDWEGDSPTDHEQRLGDIPVEIEAKTCGVRGICKLAGDVGAA